MVSKVVRMKRWALTVVLVIGHWVPAAFAEDPVIALDIDEELSAQLLQSFEAMDDDYNPRTEHFLPDGRPEYINRLILEKSPYLLQHAHNPVNWYPFGDEAFELAQKENKPVFLSIGYATCHWCHVMERESFENKAIAEYLNENYIAIKVDREQLPDVDTLYMNAVMMITGRGGWPMSNFLDSTGRPFHGGTYYPPAVFTELLEQIVDLWKTDNPALMDLADQLSDALNRANAVSATARDVGERETIRASQLALSIHDDFLGGFGGAPKFPQESLLLFLINEAKLRGDTPSINAVNYTLQRMASGGIHDQIGGGFHRYAVDDNWLVPHFEKMLYNQGLLARAYVQAYQLGGDADHKATAKAILDYVTREMMSPEGLFYSATDADSEGAEGTFFLWTPETMSSVLTDEDVKIASALWGVTEYGNFEHKTILHRSAPIEEAASELSLDTEELAEARDKIANTLLAERDKRERPLLDDKIITAWNALMITAFAEVGYALNDEGYQQIARDAAEQLWKTIHRENDTLWRTQYRGLTSVEAKQTDYAYLAESLIALYDIDGEEIWLSRAEVITKKMIELFWDTESGGFYMGESVVEGTALTIRPKDIHDSSMPSGNAVALRGLAKLYRRTGNEEYNDYANQLIAAFSGNLAEQPSGFYYMLKGVSEHLFNETGSHEYAARGVVKVNGKRLDENSVEVTVTLRDGWHINSNAPTLDYLIPTTVSSPVGGLVKTIEYPDAVNMKLGFERTELSLFEGTAKFVTQLDEKLAESEGIPLEIRVQACNDEVCLAPETVSILVPWMDTHSL